MREVGIRHLRDTEELHDYTEIVIELWDSYKMKGFSLSELGGGDSQGGIDRILYEALMFLDLVGSNEVKGWWWDGGWIEAVQSYAYYCASLARYGNIGQEYHMTQHMVLKEEHPDHIKE